MKTTGALIRQAGSPWSVEEIEIGEPRRGEVKVAMECSALCESDHNLAAGTIPMGTPPVLGGHEGAGVVVAVGEGVTGLAVGDHVVTSFLPSCGECGPCQAGLPNRCESGGNAGGLLGGASIADGSHRITTADGRPVAPMALVGTFAPYVVAHQNSLIKIDPSIPFEVASLVGCMLTTGYGAAVHAEGVSPGEDIAVIGIGIVGAAAISGAVVSGAEQIFAVDSSAERRELALKLGATHAYSTVAEALAEVGTRTGGHLCAHVIATGDPAEARDWMKLTAKGGTCVFTGMGDLSDHDSELRIPVAELLQKNLRSSIFGGGNPRHDIAELLALYKLGDLPLGDVETVEYRLEDINEGFADLRNDHLRRGFVRFTDADR